ISQNENAIDFSFPIKTVPPLDGRLEFLVDGSKEPIHGVNEGLPLSGRHFLNLLYDRTAALLVNVSDDVGDDFGQFVRPRSEVRVGADENIHGFWLLVLGSLLHVLEDEAAWNKPAGAFALLTHGDVIFLNSTAGGKELVGFRHAKANA